jgi:hypothetical protein
MNYQNQELHLDGYKIKCCDLYQSNQRRDSTSPNHTITKQPLVSSEGNSVWHVYTSEQFVIPPLSACVLNGQLEGESMATSCVCINPVEYDRRLVSGEKGGFEEITG